MKKVLFLTGCVNPNGMPYTVLTDSGIRLAQYIKAIEWYLNNTQYDIVFVENTNVDLSVFFKENERLECLTFEGNNYDKTLGKGYGEAQIIRHALLHSKKIGKADLIAKITGRLIVHNVVKIMESCNSASTLYIKKFYQKRMWFKSNFFIAPSSFFEAFTENSNKLNDSAGYYFEHLMYDIAQKWKNEKQNIKEIFSPINIEGESGSIGYTYSYGLSHTCKEYIRFFLHRLGIYYFH